MGINYIFGVVGGGGGGIEKCNVVGECKCCLAQKMGCRGGGALQSNTINIGTDCLAFSKIQIKSTLER